MAVVALFGAACGDDDDDTTTTATTEAGGEGGAEEVTVEVDGKADDFEMGTLAYFPDAVTVHPGTTVSFHSNDTGEPHTVTFGTVVDKGIEAGKRLPEPEGEGPPDPSKLTPDQKAALADVEALDEALPTMLPEGPGDANQLSANPCFVAGDTPPGDTEKPCPEMTEQPVFDGTHAVYSSGYMPGDETFEVELADDLAPGTYNFFCLLHRQGMTGSVTVVPEAQKAQTAEEVEQAGEKKLDELIAKLRPQAEEGANAPLERASAGAPPPEGEEELPALLLAFGPKELAVPVGTAVTWSVAGPHSVSFNVPEDAVGVMTKAPDGTFHANEKALAPAGGPGAPPPEESEGPPDPKAKPVLIDGGRFDGEGFRSSGFIPSFGPPGYQYKLTFTKTGTFEVRCTIHPDMKGTVKVA